MRHPTVAAASLLLAGCMGQPDPPRVPEPPRASVAFVGDWVRLTPRRLRGDTLRLRADSSADGIILWNDERDALARHWVTHFGSRAPVAARADWRDGYQDGGDADCVVGKSRVGCVSMPMLCLGAAGQYACNALKYVAPDSLFLADGSSFVRVPRLPRTVDRPAT